MKAIKYILSTVLLIAVVWSCTKVEDNFDFVSTAKAPANITAQYSIIQDNSGLVTITPTGEGAISYDVTFGDNTPEPANVKQGQSVKHTYAEGNYQVKIAGTGVTGLKTEVTQDLVVSFKAPENLVVVIENDLAVSKKVNVTANADFATFFDVYFGEVVDETPVSANIGEIASFVYQDAGTYSIRVVAKGGAIETTEYTEDFEVTAIMQPVASAPTPPARLDADVISIFSEAYTDVVGTDFNPNWGQSTVYTAFDLNGDAIIQYSNLNYQGINLGSAIDASEMEFLHIDVWTADAVSIDVYPLPDGIQSADERFVTLDLLADQWNSFDIAMADFTDQVLAVDNLMQFKFVGAGTVFIDNIYFHKAPSELATLPITFDSEAHTFIPFLDAEFALSVDPDDPSNPVGMITNHGQGWGWEGISLALDEWVDFSVNNTITMDFYTSDLPHKVLMKFEDTTSPLDGNNNPTVMEEVEVDVTATGWSELSFTYSSTNPYNSIVIFVDGNVYDITGTYYIDNIEQVSALPSVLEGTWQLAPEAGALKVGDSYGAGNWWTSDAQAVIDRACLFDDTYVFGAGESFSNVLGTDTWLEDWQGTADACGTPVAPHDGSANATFTYDEVAGTITLNGAGAYLGIPKANNAGELPNVAVPASITYDVTLSDNNNTMTLVIEVGTGAFWTFKLVRNVSPIVGTWKLAPEAGALKVGDSYGAGNWWTSDAQAVIDRACLFDDDYVFGSDGSFTNVLGTDTWLEDWQGTADACGTPVAPHDGSAIATYLYDSAAETVTINGAGAYLGIPKANNAGELPNVAVPDSITYDITLSDNDNTMTLVIEVGSGAYWSFKLVK